MQNNVDLYGFVKKTPIIEISQKSAEKKLNARIEKWRNMLSDYDNFYITNPKKLKNRIRKGIPDCLRGKVWSLLAEIDKFKYSESYQYRDLLGKISGQENIIKLDLDRTFPNNIYFQKENKIGQNSLKEILNAISLVFKDVGYCQGLNFVSAIFLLYVNDENAFWLVFSLLEKYQLKNIFSNIKLVEKYVFIYEKLLENFLPNHLLQLRKCNLEPILFANSWFITLFIHVLPFQTVIRIIDIYLLEKEIVLYRIGLAIIKILEPIILNKKNNLVEIMNAFSQLQSEAFQNPDEVIKIAFYFKIKEKDISKYQDEFFKNNPNFCQKPEKPIKKAKIIEKIDYFVEDKTDYEIEMEETIHLDIKSLKKCVMDGSIRQLLTQNLNEKFEPFEHYQN